MPRLHRCCTHLELQRGRFRITGRDLPKLPIDQSADGEPHVWLWSRLRIEEIGGTQRSAENLTSQYAFLGSKNLILPKQKGPNRETRATADLSSVPAAAGMPRSLTTKLASLVA